MPYAKNSKKTGVRGQTNPAQTHANKHPVGSLASNKDAVDLAAGTGAVAIGRLSAVRPGWAEAARRMRHRDEDALLDPPMFTHFDELEWK